MSSFLLPRRPSLGWTRSLVALSLVLTASFLPACSDDAEETDSSTEETVTETAPLVFVSTLPDASTSIAVATGTTRAADGTAEATVYLCDGEAKSTWFFGTEKAGVLRATAKSGATFEGALETNQVVGTLDFPGETPIDVDVPQANGVAGIYLVQHDGKAVEGYSAQRAHLVGTVEGGNVKGTVTPNEGKAVTLEGAIKAFGEGDVSTWIVQEDGSVVGRTDATGTAGGGNCTAWQSIKSLMFGVHCAFLSR